MINELIMLAISLVGVSLVVLLVWWLGLGNSSIGSESEAAEAAEALAAGFTAGPVLLDKDGKAALVADAYGGGFIILKQAGQHLCGRYLSTLKWQADGNDNIILDSEDRWFGQVQIAPSEAQAAAQMRALIERAA